ncbi:MAG TPA: hypothetical protein VGA33_12330 [Thermoanaerobaculia bacterium]
MNANRKADLQRKLTLAPVPKPPAGLAERIKSDIPKQLRFSAEKERQRFFRAITFNLSVAAAILVLISSTYLALQLMSRVEDEKRPGALDKITIAPMRRTQAQAPAAPPPQQAAAAKLEKRAPKKKQVLVAEAQKNEEKQPRRVESLAAPAPPPPPPVAQAEGRAVAAKSLALDRADTVVMTISPVSGKQMTYATRENRVAVVDEEATRNSVAEKINVKLTPWAELPRETKLKILEAELAGGGDRKVIARVAREAGLNEFADSIEKR